MEEQPVYGRRIGLVHIKVDLEREKKKQAPGDVSLTFKGSPLVTYSFLLLFGFCLFYFVLFCFV